MLNQQKYQKAYQDYNQKLERIESHEMVINMGPQHPSTHGVLRLELITDGELVKGMICP